MSDEQRELHREEWKRNGDVAFGVSCRVCGREMALWFNGGELDRRECCGLEYRLEHVRVAIAGVPRAGKTTFAKVMAQRTEAPMFSTDDLISMSWSAASEEASRWFDLEGPLIVEGMAVPRALRKWLRAHDEGRPVDVLIWLGTPRESGPPGHDAMGKGAFTVLEEIAGTLLERGVRVEFPGPLT